MNTRTTPILVLPYLVLISVALFLPGCPQIIGGAATDVPCLVPSAWPNENILFLTRSEQDDFGALLLAHQSVDQSLEDLRDGVFGISHGPVYRLDPDTGNFELVDDSQWDNANGAVGGCAGQRGNNDSALRVVRRGNVSDLEFEGQPVSVAGGNAVSLWTAPRSTVAAVISSSGGGSVPFLTCRVSSGQHYQQLFSTVDGTALGQPVRIAPTGNPCAPDACWSSDERFVVYSQRGSGDRFTSICVVDVSDIIAGLSANNEADSPETGDP